MDEWQDAIACVQRALAVAEANDYTAIVVELEDALYLLQYMYIERAKKYEQK